MKHCDQLVLGKALDDIRFCKHKATYVIRVKTTKQVHESLCYQHAKRIKLLIMGSDIELVKMEN